MRCLVAESTEIGLHEPVEDRELELSVEVAKQTSESAMSVSLAANAHQVTRVLSSGVFVVWTRLLLDYAA